LTKKTGKPPSVGVILNAIPLDPRSYSLEIDSKHLMVGHELEHTKCKIKNYMKTWKQEQCSDGRLIKEKIVTVNDLDTVQSGLAYTIPREYVPRTDCKSAEEIAQVLALSNSTVYFTVPICNDTIDNIQKMVAAAEAPEDVPVAIESITEDDLWRYLA
jgi:hypothetical protein